jgi:hypothetical protein
MNITLRHWYLGIALIVAALVLHALIPRYDWHLTSGAAIRVDRWTGTAVGGRFEHGRWVPVVPTAAPPGQAP